MAETGDEFETRASNLAAEKWRGFGNPPGNPSHPEIPIVAPTPIDANVVACSNLAGFTHIFVRDSNKNFRGRTMALFDGVATGPWSGAIGSQQFWSSPACTMLQLTYSTNSTMLLAGKALDNRIYVQLLTGDNASAGPDDPATPPAQTAWGQLSGTQYTGGSNGFPAVSANGSRMVVTFRNNNTIIAHNRALPFSPFSPWSGAQNAPALPFGVTLTGVPAITYVGASTNAFVVVVKTTTPGVIYWIRYSGTGYVGGWTRAALPHTLTSDPAMEWVNYTTGDGTPYVTLTLYFKDETNNIVQTSVNSPSEFATGSYFYIPTSGTVLGTPSAVFGGGLESGIRTVVVQGYTPETPVSDRSAAYLVSEDLCGGGCVGF